MANLKLKNLWLINLLILPILSFGQGYWKKEEFSNKIDKRYQAISFTCNHRAFVMGGSDSMNVTIEDFFELDWSTKTWKKPNAQFSGLIASSQVVFVIDTFAYIGMGINSGYGCIQEFYKYDVTKDTFTKIADFPGTGRLGSVAFAANGKGYVGFGMDDSGTMHSDFYEYNPVTNAWKKTADFPGDPRIYGIATSFKDMGIVGLGFTDAGSSLNDLYSFNTVTGKWKKLDDFCDHGRFQSVAFTFEGIPYIGLGLMEGVGFDPLLYQYDSFSGTWNSMELNNEFLGFGSTVLVFDDVFVVGFGKYNFTSLNTDLFSFNKWGLKSSLVGKSSFNLFPNPCTHQLKITFNESAVGSELSILDYSGRTIKTIDLGSHPSNLTLNLQGFTPGMYFVKMNNHCVPFVKE